MNDRHAPPDDDGYRLWLRYEPVAGPRLVEYRSLFTEIVAPGGAPTREAARSELARGLAGITAHRVPFAGAPYETGAVIAGTPQSSQLVAGLGLDATLATLGPEGYLIRRSDVLGRPATVIASSTDVGVLYGVFHLLRLLQTQTDVRHLSIESKPRIRHRLLNHWDNLDRTIERGYAGFSRWDWQKLPGWVGDDITDYARADASIGINGAALTNVNANALILTPEWLDKVAALADTLRPWGVRAYLTARFDAPVERGALRTADPLDGDVQAFWRRTAEAIYRRIPDFGGFVVKANSEGQPGPQDYGRSHADGANLLADALAPHGGTVFWRAFVYSNEVPVDRARQAYEELVPLDGAFRENVIVQVKNGPIDFQPREPFHPLFGAMPKTPLALELMITQEYLGFSTHLVYLGPLFEECLRSDTHASGPGSTVARIVDGTLEGHERSAMVGVANIGTDRNWCGHPCAAANWYAFGRLAWDHELSSAKIAEEWLRMTFTNDRDFVEGGKDILLASREAAVDYMTPLGLHHLMARDHHYGPGPWVEGGKRADWTSVYYHRADEAGLGFDRSATGSNAVAQYHGVLAERFGRLESCPEELLLWFHHVSWDHRLASGDTLWESLCRTYYEGVASVARMRSQWDAFRGLIDDARFRHVKALLAMQEQEARWWRDACVLYFQTFSKRELPEGLEPPLGTLADYRAIEHRFVPGI